MGTCATSAAMSEEQIRSQNIDAEMNRAEKDENEKIKLLLLGAGESGKSTFFKQIDLLYGKPWSRDKRAEFRPIIFENTIDAMKTILTDGFLTLEGDIPADLEAKAALILQIVKDAGGTYNLTEEIAAGIDSLWQEPLVKQAFDNRAEYQLYDSAEYFFNKVVQLCKPDYLPDSQDILRSRVRTTGIHEQTFLINDVEFIFVDVGGQRNERKKWIHCFENVTAVIFLAALSAYDQVLMEKDNVNRLNEAIALFEHIVNSNFFQQPSMILFLNKDDLFRERIQTKDLRNDEKKWFTDYEGGCDEEAAYKYIENKFLSKCRNKDKQIFVKRTTATDTRNMETVFDAARETILAQAAGQVFGEGAS